MRKNIPSYVARTLTILVLLSVPSLIQANTAYKAVEWNSLQAPNWIPPIIQAAPTKDHEHSLVDQDSLVKSIDQSHIKIPGFLMPIKFEANVVSEFVLVPFLEHHVKAHVHHEANQMIYVQLKTPVKITNRYQAIWVKGLITLESQHTEEGVTGYFLKNASVSEYKY